MDATLFWVVNEHANAEMQKAARRLVKKAKSNLSAMLKNPSGRLKSHVGYKLAKQDTSFVGIKLRTYRYGIIREHGAGRGWPGGKDANSESTSPRTPAPWITDAFESIIPDLADTMSALKGDDMVAQFDADMNKNLGRNYRI